MIGLAALLPLASRVVADDVHYRSVPIGAHAIALGGTFVGVADDASAAYFNPAGLALGTTHGLAGGLSINAWNRYFLEDALQSPDGSANATVKNGFTVPISIGAVLKFGQKDALEQKKFALGLSVVDPVYSGGGNFFKIESDPLTLTDTYRVNQSDRGTWYGVSFAGRLNLRQSIGASLYLSVRKLNHSETGLALGGGMPAPDVTDAFVGTSSAANSQSLGFKAFHFILRFGWLYRIKPQLQLGVMLQPPGIPLKQTVNTFSQGFINDNQDPTAPVTTQTYFFDEEVGANLPIPMELDAGLEYWPAENVMLAFDAAFYGPVRSSQRVETSQSVPIGGLFFDDDTGRRAIGNVGIAGDFFIGRKVTISTGFFTDLSSAKDIPANPEKPYNPQINRFGGTLSLGLDIAGVAITVGSTVLYGRGDVTGVTVTGSNLLVEYDRTQATSRTVYLHITGATRAASSLGDKTARGIRARRERKKKKAEPDGDPSQTD